MTELEKQADPLGWKLMPVTIADLVKWEKDLDDLNLQCVVPREELSLLFKPSEIDALFASGTPNRDNISYDTRRSAFSVGSVNNAYAWSQLLKKVNWRGHKTVELGPGTSRVIEMALTLDGFAGVHTKVDYSEWKDLGGSSYQPTFDTRWQTTDVVKEPDKIPETDLLVMSHFWDDLYMGLWAQDAGVDYFGEAMNKADRNQDCWRRAIPEAGKYMSTVDALVDAIGKRVLPSGMIIIKNHPSGFETLHRQVERVNFTFGLTNHVVERFTQNDFDLVPVDLNTVQGAAGSKYPNSFFVLRRR